MAAEEGTTWRNALVLSVDPTQAASINGRRVSDGVDVSELRVSEQSLETVFLELTESPQPEPPVL